MSKPKRATECGLPPFWKVRIHLGGGIIHVASLTEPRLTIDPFTEKPDGIEWQLIEGTEHGDSVGYIDWSQVAAVTWRFAPEVRS